MYIDVEAPQPQSGEIHGSWVPWKLRIHFYGQRMLVSSDTPATSQSIEFHRVHQI